MADVLLAPKEKGKPNWLRMLKAFNALDVDDARLKAGKGWMIESMDSVRICEGLTKLGIEHEKVDNYKVFIL
jgi:hypothetical protein